MTNGNAFGVGSLRGVLAYAAGQAGADTVTFHPSLAGQTIVPGAIAVNDAAGVTIDASALAGGLKLDGATGTGGAILRLFYSPGIAAALHVPVRFGALDLIYELERSLPGVGPWVKIAEVDAFRGTFTTNYVPGILHTGDTPTESIFLDTTVPFQSKAFYRLKVRGL